MTYHLAIGDRTYSSWSLRGWLLFAKFDIPVTVRQARMYSPEFHEMLRDFGGGRLVPALRIDAERPIIVTDTLAIAETLNERHPDKRMWPADPVARGFARSVTAEIHSGFMTMRTDCTMNLRHVYNGFAPAAPVRKDLERITEILAQGRDQKGGSGPWLLGDYSIADAFLAPLASRIATYKLPVDPLVQAYVDTTLNDPAFREWRAAGLAENYVQPGYDLDLPTESWPVNQ